MGAPISRVPAPDCKLHRYRVLAPHHWNSASWVSRIPLLCSDHWKSHLIMQQAKFPITKSLRRERLLIPGSYRFPRFVDGMMSTGWLLPTILTHRSPAISPSTAGNCQEPARPSIERCTPKDRLITIKITRAPPPTTNSDNCARSCSVSFATFAKARRSGCRRQSVLQLLPKQPSFSLHQVGPRHQMQRDRRDGKIVSFASELFEQGLHPQVAH